MRMATRMADQPDASIPERAGDWSATVGAYRFLNNERIDPEAIGTPAIARTRQACAARSVVLCLHDLTELKPVHRVSPTRLFQHTALAVDGDSGAALGILHQRWFDEPVARRGETRDQRRARWRHSCTWPEAVQAIGSIDQVPRVLAVADREADDFQMFHACLAAGQGWVIRSQHDRYLEGEPCRLRDALGKVERAGWTTLAVSRQSKMVDARAPLVRKRSARRARQARLAVRFKAVTVAPPRNDPRHTTPLEMVAVSVREEKAPADGSPPVDWLLLTSEPVHSLSDALTVVGYYRRRWLIEEYHKAQKTGCRLEQAQLESGEAIRRLAAIAGVVAVRLLQLREAAHDPRNAQEPAIEHVEPLWVKVVATLARTDANTMTLQAFYHAIARRGGWLARKHDGPPGWQTLWRGWQKISDLIIGIQLLQESPDLGCV